jgi:hypothetical protein
MRVAIDSSHKLILAFFLLIGLLFLSIAMSVFLGDILGSLSLGYIIVGLFYIFVTILCAAFLKPVLRKIILKRASISYYFDDGEVPVSQVRNSEKSTPTTIQNKELEDLH